ncbi:MAG: TonB-dependent receptor, partial [Candidatus Poribacteria bacterium]|nr:TonB-dependent receptor [Candidatus Poribacteria bacterium]
KLLYGEAFRAPAFMERDFHVPGILDPNPSLEPERVRTVEAVWEQRIRQDYYATASVYHNRMTNLIVTGLAPVGAAARFENLGEANVTGTEFEVSARWQSRRSASLAYSYQKTESAPTGEALNYAPSHLVKCAVASPVFDLMTLAVEGRHTSFQYTSGSLSGLPRRRIDGATVIDATATTKPIWGGFTARLRAHNLLNTVYRGPIAPYRSPFEPDTVLDSIRQDERQIIASVNTRF